MSKLINIYDNLKKNSSEDDLILFKAGAFYLFIDKDAQKASELLGLKLTYLNSSTQKCGFPLNSLDKYINLLQDANYNIQIVDSASSTAYTVQEFEIADNYKQMTDILAGANINDMTGVEALIMLDKLKKLATSAKGGVLNG